MRGAWLGVLLLLAGAGPAAAAAVEVLAPAPDARVAGDSAWLVLRAAAPPAVLLEGAPVVPRVVEGEVYHYRLGPLSGGRGTVQLGAGTRLVVGGGGAAFHATGATACWECHDGGDDGCGECHPAPGDGGHRALLAEGCGPCHGGAERSPGAVQELCSGCHPRFAAGRHGRIRHAVSSERDPLRPGQAMDCTSCHDPHAPRCLSCLDRGVLRDWCKRCHGGP